MTVSPLSPSLTTARHALPNHEFCPRVNLRTLLAGSFLSAWEIMAL
jgi:hypothetical protein